MKNLSEWRLKLAIVSQTPRFQLDDQLIRFDLHRYFSSVMACGDCPLEKPDPLPLIETAKRIGVEPENMAYVGDMYEDIICARKAGVLSIALDRPEGSYHTRTRLLEARPDFIVTSLTELLVLLAFSQMREVA
jgi:phosphoglycolate phosphatase-like HAD superfamily hydrolase